MYVRARYERKEVFLDYYDARWYRVDGYFGRQKKGAGDYILQDI